MEGKELAILDKQKDKIGCRKRMNLFLAISAISDEKLERVNKAKMLFDIQLIT